MMTLRKPRDIQLDFRGGGSAGYWTGWALLAIAMLFLFDLGFTWVGTRSEIARSEEALAASSRQVRAAVPARAVSKEELTLARETIQRISLPWYGLFGALESARSEQVALIAIEPDPQAGTVLISGEAKDYATALDYVQQLRQAKTLRDVHLVKHEVLNTPERPVGFSVAASWSR